MELATFGSGCFWCTEAIFQRVKGVTNVVSGYSGGKAEDADYKKVCSGTTDHAEVVQISFDPAIVSYEELLEIFWKTHDPTTPNRQGNDVGPQYRSVIFYHNDQQKLASEKIKKALNESGIFDSSIVTEINEYDTFYSGEEYHQDYFNQNLGANPYCTYVINPKVEKFKQLFNNSLK